MKPVETNQPHPENPGAEAEDALLGACLLSRHAVDEALNLLGPEHFHRLTNGQIFAAIAACWKRGEPIDDVTLVDQLRRDQTLDNIGGPQRLGDLAAACPSTVRAAEYARQIREAWRSRELISAARRIAELAQTATPDETLDQAERLLAPIRDQRRHTSRTLGDAAYDAAQHLEDRHNGQQPEGVVPYGHTDIDEKTGGLHPGQLVLAGARASMGKSAFALGVAVHSARTTGKDTLYFSLEMSAEELGERALATYTPTDSAAIRSGKYGDFDLRRMAKCAIGMHDWRVVVDDEAVISPHEIRARTRRHAARNALGLVVVDYLQLLETAKAETRERAVAEATRTLKLVARECSVPVLACAQLNRASESRSDKKPMLSDFRESGAQEMDADVCLLIHRPGYYSADADQHVAEVTVAKNRNGPTGMVKLDWDGSHMRFRDRDKGLA